jgi:hypothetical protein
MADNNEQEQKIVISVDKAAADSALKSIKALNTESTKLGTSLKQAGKDSTNYAQQLRSAIKEDNAATKSVNELGEALRKQAKGTKEAKQALDDYADSAKNAKGASEGGGLGGQVADIRGALGSAGISSPALEVAGGLSDAIQAFGTLNPIAITAAASIGVISLALGELGRQAQDQVNQINSIFEAKRAADQQVIDGLTTDQAVAEIDRLQQSIDKEKETLAEANSAYSQAVNRFGGFLASVIPQSAAIATQITTSEANIASAEATINEYNKAISDGELATNDLAEAEAGLAQTREADSQRAIAQAEAANQRIAALEQQRSDLITNRAIADSNADASSALERKFANEDEIAESINHYAALADIASDGAAKVEAIAQEIANLPTQEAKALADIASKGTKELNKLNGDYFASQIKATKDFSKESARIATDTAKAAQRIADKFADNLADAARDNDVVAFLELQRDGQKELKENAEDAKEAEKRRAQDFAEQQDEQRQAFQQRQAEILSNLAEERAQVTQTFAEKRAALELQKQQEIANTQQAIANANARYQAEEAREAQAADRNKQRAALRQAQEDAAFQRQLKAISDKTAAELAGIQRVISAANSMSSSSKQAKQTPIDYKSGKNYGYSGSGSSGSFGGNSGSKQSGNNTIVVNTTVGDVATASQVSNAINKSLEQFGGALLGGMAKAQGG